MVATVSYSAKEAKDPAVSTSRACSNGRSREDKYSYSTLTTVGRIYAKAQSICHRYML